MAVTKMNVHQQVVLIRVRAEASTGFEALPVEVQSARQFFQDCRFLLLAKRSKRESAAQARQEASALCGARVSTTTMSDAPLVRRNAVHIEQFLLPALSLMPTGQSQPSVATIVYS
eukprot:scaffold111388_cov40-Prasinocladus_malaysianus.AAC.1